MDPEQRLGDIMTTILSQTSCRQCGTCCRNGGPALHLADADVVKNGLLDPACLMTIRPGEPIRDNVRGRNALAAGDIIRICGTGASWTCAFYREASRDCGIYPHRPIQCRELKCWEPDAVIRMYEKDRLTRMDIFGRHEGLRHLIEEHEAAVSFGEVRPMVLSVIEKKNADRPLLRRLDTLLFLDREFRRRSREQNIFPGEWEHLILGRPLETILRTMGLRVDESRKGRVIRPGGGVKKPL